MLLCHGGPGARDYLEPVADFLVGSARVHRFDQRGGGRSDACPPVTIDRLLRDMERLRQHWGHDEWVVGGHSWGAHLALFYALAHPDATSALVFLNGTGLRWGWGPHRRRRRLPRLTAAERAEVESLERALAHARDPRKLARLRALMWLTDFADRSKAERVPPPVEQPDPDVVTSLEKDWEQRLAGIETDVAQCQVPALVLHSECDPIGEDGPREIAELLPRAQFFVLAGVGHLPWLEDPRGTDRAVNGYLQQVMRRADG